MIASSQFVSKKAVAILCVGDPKSGKTRLAMSFPRPGILDCDGNLGSAIRVAGGKEFLVSQPFATDDGKEVPVNERWPRAVDETKKLLASPDTQSFILDGLSNLCQWGLAYCEVELTKAGIDIKKEYLAKYQRFIPLMSNYITMLRIPGKFVIVNVHQTMDRDDITKSVRYELDIPGRLKNTLGGQFTDVWGMSSTADSSNTTIGAKYEIRTKPSGFHVNLGTSLDLTPSINITGKTPQEIWTLLEPKLSVNVTK